MRMDDGSRRACVGMVATRKSIVLAVDRDADAAVLRQPPLGDIEAGHDLDARDDRAAMCGGGVCRPRQHAVDAEADGKAALEGLDVDSTSLEPSVSRQSCWDRSARRDHGDHARQIVPATIRDARPITRRSPSRSGLSPCSATAIEGQQFSMNLDDPTRHH